LTKPTIDGALAELEQQLKELDAARAGLKAKIEHLRRTFKNTPPAVAESSNWVPASGMGPTFDSPERLISAGTSLRSFLSVSNASPISEKIALFCSLFKGRDDVFALRWESSKSGKSGYQPVCANEWVSGVCRKPHVKCAACPSREFVPLSDRVIRRHLFGINPNQGARRSQKEFVAGIYPLLRDERCWLLALDFDKATWFADVAVFRETCERIGILTSVERSRSGNGAHTWIFFSEPVPAAAARRLGTFLLTQTLDRRPEVGLDSYDRLFPNQDTLPKGGFGSLIALPLQHAAVLKENSVFVREDFVAYPDQWQYLASVRRLKRCDVEKIVEGAIETDSVFSVRLPASDDEEEEPWRMRPSRREKEPAIEGPLPETVRIVLGNGIYFEKANLPAVLKARLIRTASFQNPEFYKAQAMRISTFGKPRIICCAEDLARHICLPRGCLEDAVGILRELGIAVEVRDERGAGRPLKCSFVGDLRPEQERAFKALLETETGVLAAATAFGKTVIAAKMIAARGANTLILVHRRHLLDHWAAQLKVFLGLAPGDIGFIGAGKRKPGNLIDIALIQSLCRKGIVSDLVEGYGHLIVDECHHIPAVSFEQVARRAKAKYVLGLSATVSRRDGHHPIIFMQCGPVRYRVGTKQGAQAHPFDHFVMVRKTRFALSSGASPNPPIQEIYKLLTKDERRNEMIFEDVMASIVNEKRSPVLITERREHLEMLAVRFRDLLRNVIVFKGGMGLKQRKALNEKLAAIKDDEERLLIATGRYLGEGFDDARLDTLFLTLPISWKGTLAQYAGRLHRLHYSKREVRIYDYVDMKVPMLERMFKRRLSGYRSLGYETIGDIADYAKKRRRRVEDVIRKDLFK